MTKHNSCVRECALSARVEKVWLLLKVLEPMWKTLTMQSSVFTNMFSLLNPPLEGASWPVSLHLPYLNLSPPTAFFASPVYLPEKTEDPEPVETTRVTACPHSDKKHYAKKMCLNCYHKFGRTKLAWKCSHKQRLHYAKGKCHMCYLHQLSHRKVGRVVRAKKC